MKSLLVVLVVVGLGAGAAYASSAGTFVSGGYTYVVAEEPASESRADTVIATCPGNLVVVGGGGRVSNGGALVSSRPYFNEDDLVPDDGWAASFRAFPGKTLRGLSAYAICAPPI